MQYIKAILKGTQDADGEKVFRFLASDDTLDRQGEVVTTDGWETENFAKNPVFLWAHGYDSPPIGKVVQHQSGDGGLEIGVVFDQEDQFAKSIAGKYERGFLSAVSVGFIPKSIQIDGEGKDAPRLTQKELLEVSAVPVPANPNALIMRQYSGIRQALAELEDKAAIASHSTGVTDAEFDGPEMDARLPNTEAALRAAHAWMDSEGDPEAKSSYKFIHHMVSENGDVGDANLRGCVSGIGVLNGGRGGADIPDSDREGVHAHLARHMMDGDMEPPELRSFTAVTDKEVSDTYVEKQGRVLSRANEERLRNAASLITEVLASLPQEEAVDPVDFDFDLSTLKAFVTD